jgi:hypothetical protein
MLRYRKPSRIALLPVLIGLGAALPGNIAFADSVPESIRIQQKAEKAYEAAPVAPIERQNAHHRELSRDAPASGDERTQPVVPYMPRLDSDR